MHVPEISEEAESPRPTKAKLLMRNSLAAFGGWISTILISLFWGVLLGFKAIDERTLQIATGISGFGMSVFYVLAIYFLLKAKGFTVVGWLVGATVLVVGCNFLMDQMTTMNFIIGFGLLGALPLFLSTRPDAELD